MLEEYKRDIYLCSKCEDPRFGAFEASGRPICPTGEKFLFESYSVTGRMANAKALMEGDLEWSERLIDRYFTCLRCGACSENCYKETGGNLLKVIEEVEKELVRRGIGPHFKQRYENYENFFKNYKERQEEEIKKMSESVALYFLGCNLSCYNKDIIEATLKILESTGEKFTTSPRTWCCGYPLIYTGQVEQAMDIVTSNIAAIERLGIEKIISNCPHCTRIFKHDYPKILGIEFGFKVLHTSEYLSEMIKNGALKPKIPVMEKVTYHDPCLLGRQGGKVYDQPREILRSIPGINLVEMDRRMGNAWCCGAGAMVKVAYPDFALWTATNRIEEAESKGVCIIVSACPECKNILMEAANIKGKVLRILDVNELLAKSLGLI